MGDLIAECGSTPSIASVLAEPVDIRGAPGLPRSPMEVFNMAQRLGAEERVRVVSR